MTDNVKTPTRPGSKWATGRRVKQEPLREKPGFYQGALVDPRAAQRASLAKPKPRPSSSRRRTTRPGSES